MALQAAGLEQDLACGALFRSDWNTKRQGHNNFQKIELSFDCGQKVAVGIH